MIDWFDLLAVQRTLKSLLWDHNSKALILQHSAFFMVQFSHPYMTTGKTTALIIPNFVGKAMSQLFITLSRFVMAFLPRCKCLLISWMQSLSQWSNECWQFDLCHYILQGIILKLDFKKSKDFWNYLSKKTPKLLRQKKSFIYWRQEKGRLKKTLNFYQSNTSHPESWAKEQWEKSSLSNWV